MMYRRSVAGLVSLFALAGCGGATVNQPATTQGGPTQVRQRPRRRNVQHVLSEAVRRASECLPRAAGTVAVSGAFRGETGEFRVENVESTAPLGTSVRTCVREEFESAHVEAFADDRYSAMRSFGPDGVIISAQNGNAPVSRPAAGGELPVLTGAASSPPPPSNPEFPLVSSAAPEVASAPPSPAPTPPETVAASPAPAVHPGARTTAPAADTGPLPTSVVAGCYQSVVRANPTVGGRVRLRLEVTADGVARGVSSAAVGTPTGPLPLFNTAVRCIEQRTRAFAFPRSASGAVDLVITMAPGPRGGSVSIARRNAGLTNAAPGAETVDATGGAEPAAGGIVAQRTFNEQIGDTVRAHVGEIRGCYQTQLARSPELQLRTHVRFTIEPAGRVALASSTTVVLAGEPDAATAVAQCVETIVRGTGFPARSGGTPLETSLPFSFSPGASQSAVAGGGGAAMGAAAPTRAAVTGRIDAARTGAVIRANTDQVRACYTRALQTHPDLSGRVMVRFTVDTSGRVSAPSSQVTPISGDRDAFDGVASCIEQVLTTLTLPPPDGGPAAVALPFDFSPNAL